MIQKFLSLPWVKSLLSHPLVAKVLNYEVISYVVCGVLTTVINWISYYFLDKQGLSTLWSNAIAWLLAVIFAYFSNKIFVFRSKEWSISVLWAEFVPFITCRILSGVFDVGFMLVTVDYLHCYKFLAKIFSNFFVMLANYFASKFLIFKKSN